MFAVYSLNDIQFYCHCKEPKDRVLKVTQTGGVHRGNLKSIHVDFCQEILQ